MKKVALYSSSPWSRKPEQAPRRRGFRARTRSDADADNARGATGPPARKAWFRRFGERHERALFLVAGALIALTIAGVYLATRPQPRVLTQKDIDAAVLHTLETAQMPSVASKAFEAIRPSVVRVIGSGARNPIPAKATALVRAADSASAPASSSSTRASS